MSLLLFLMFKCYYGSVLPACHHIHLQRLEESIGYSRTGVTGHREPLCGCWKSSLSPVKEQAVLFTKPSLQHPFVADLYFLLSFKAVYGLNTSMATHTVSP